MPRAFGYSALWRYNEADVVYVLSQAAINFNAAGQHTWMGWIRPTFPFNSNNAGQISLKASDGTNGYAVYLEGGANAYFQWQERKGFATNGVLFGNCYMGQWSHIAVTFNGVAHTVKFYRNGAELTVGAYQNINWANVVSNSASDFYWGIPYAPLNYSGKMAQMQFYGAELTLAQIQANYRAGTIAPGIIFYHKLNEGSGTTAVDSSGNGIDGTLSGPTYSTDVPMALRSVAGARAAVV